jgi:HEPN domain-containing protein
LALQWLAHAESDLAIAAGRDRPGVLLESLCFHAQHAAEKALKAVLVAYGADPPRTHDLDVLQAALPAGTGAGWDPVAIASLTVYAVASRYPGDSEPVDQEEYARALDVASSVLAWARATLAGLADDGE